MSRRVESLDWLRGLMAISIMLYHLTCFIIHPLNSNSLLGRLGIYGVSIFFILSGLSIAIAYSRFIKDLRTSIYFMIRRICRIWPLLWVCIALLILPSVLAGRFNIPISRILLNITTLFGFVQTGAYLNAGAWSLGSEMVFYAMTPIIIILYENNRLYGNIVLALSFVVMVIFSFFLLNKGITISDQWSTYINPFNNLFLYVSGIAIFYNLRNVKVPDMAAIIAFVISGVFFIWFPVAGDQVSIVTGVNRILFVAAAILMVISFYKYSAYDRVPKVLLVPLEQFGIATYGVYLFHPLVHSYLSGIFFKLRINQPSLLFALSVLITFVVALVSYNLFEVKVIRLGKKLTSTKDKLLPVYGSV